jgi:hypothetical protein
LSSGAQRTLFNLNCATLQDCYDQLLFRRQPIFQAQSRGIAWKNGFACPFWHINFNLIRDFLSGGATII